MEHTMKKLLIAALLILLAVVSALFLADKAMTPETHQKTIASLDEKTVTVLKLTATSTVASAAVSAFLRMVLPDSSPFAK